MSQPKRPRRITLAIDPVAYATLGIDPASASAAEIYALIDRAAASIQRASAVEAALSRGEWNLIADALNGTIPGPVDPRDEIAFELEDAGGGLGAKWGVDLDALIRKIRELSEQEAEAVFAAVRWLWSRGDAIDPDEDRWWTAAFRTREFRP